jgi:hypothetical protein
MLATLYPFPAGPETSFEVMVPWVRDLEERKE